MSTFCSNYSSTSLRHIVNIFPENFNTNFIPCLLQLKPKAFLWMYNRSVQFIFQLAPNLLEGVEVGLWGCQSIIFNVPAEQLARDTHFYIFPPPSVGHTLFACCQTVQTWTHQFTTLYTNLPLSISCVLLQISGVSLYFSLSVMVSLLLFCQQVLLQVSVAQFLKSVKIPGI